MNKGKCLCGSVTWEIEGEPYQSYNCHCRMCQKVHGAAFGTYWFLKGDQIRWTSSTDTIVHFRSSDVLVRASCDVCGSVVPYCGDDEEHWVAPGGCHDNGRKSDCNIFVPDSSPWHTISGDLPQHDVYPDDSGLPSVPGKPVTEGPESIVRGSCQCGAVEFHVSEPFKVAHNCHCTRCRQGRSAAHASNGFTAADAVTFVKGEDQLKSYKVPDAKFFTQTFCKTCSSLMPRIDEGRGIAIIPLGCLDDDPGVKPIDHIYVADKAGWHEITDDLPIYEQGLPG